MARFFPQICFKSHFSIIYRRSITILVRQNYCYLHFKSRYAIAQVNIFINHCIWYNIEYLITTHGYHRNNIPVKVKICSKWMRTPRALSENRSMEWVFYMDGISDSSTRHLVEKESAVQAHCITSSLIIILQWFQISCDTYIYLLSYMINWKLS